MTYTPKKTTTFFTFLFTLLILSSSYHFVFASEVNNSSLDPKLEDSIILFMGKPNAYVDRKPRLIDKSDSTITPIMKNGRTLIPLRFIGEGLGAETNWNQRTRTVTLIYEGKEVKVTIGQKKMIVGNKEIIIDTYPEMSNNRIFLPLRAVVEAFDKEVFYDRGLIIISETKGIYNPINDDDKIRYLIGRFINPLQDSIVLKIGQSNAIINNEKTPIDSSGLSIKPIMQNNRVLLPVRFIGESLGATVSWDKESETSILTLGSKTIKVPMGEKHIVVNDVKKTMDISPQIINGRTFLPLRAISEAFNKTVNYKHGIIVISDEGVFVYDEKKVVDRFNYITFGSSEKDLSSVLGDPVHHIKETINGSLYKVLIYGKSANYFKYPEYGWDDHLYINGRRSDYFEIGRIFIKDGRVIGWENPKGDLKVKTSDVDPFALPFTFGSSKEEVSLVMGTPSSYHYDADTDLTLWSYDEGHVRFKGKSVIGWENRTAKNKTLNASLPKSNTQATTFDFGASLPDVVKIMGLPSSAYKEHQYTTLYYDGGGVEFLNNTLVGYSNESGKLKINIKVPNSDAAEITLNSSIEDVINVLGNPHTLTVEDHQDFYDIKLTYGDSKITFTSEFGNALKIKDMWDYGNLKIDKDADLNSSFFIGSSKDEVLKAMGTPDRIQYYDDSVSFHYGYSSVQLAYKANEPRQSPFEGFYVVDYYDSGSLNLTKADPNAEPFKYWSTLNEVIEAMGPPDHRWSMGIYKYGESQINFVFDESTSNYRVSGFTNKGELKISFGEKQESSTFFIGSTLNDLVKAMGNPNKLYIQDDKMVLHYQESLVTLSKDDFIVISYRDKGELTSALPQQQIIGQFFTLGSPLEDVLSTMGVPNSIDPTTHYGGEKLYYGDSYVHLNEDSAVASYFNAGNLKVYMGEKEANATPFKLGSPLEDVIKANGTPSYYGYSDRDNKRTYGVSYRSVPNQNDASYVILNQELKVIEYINKGLLNVNLGEKGINPTPATLGSTLEEVIVAHGTPSEFKNENGTFYAKYGESFIYFTEDLRVVRYDNKGELSFNLGEKQPDAPPFTIGSSVEEVTRAMGTPALITTNYSSDKVLVYNDSSVSLDDNNQVMAFGNEGDLLVDMGDKDPNASRFKIGSHLDDVIKTLGTPTHYLVIYDGYHGDGYIRLYYDSSPYSVILSLDKFVQSVGDANYFNNYD